jgi:hypothetical protein
MGGRGSETDHRPHLKIHLALTSSRVARLRKTPKISRPE